MEKIKAVLLLSLFSLMGTSLNTWADAMSWNLARDVVFIKSNPAPNSPWAFMQNASGLNKPESYTLLPVFTADTCSGNAATCWADPLSMALVSVHFKTFTFTENGGYVLQPGNLALHPGKNSQTIVRWNSPIIGDINVLGRVNHIHDGCGDGVSWSLNLDGAVLQSGTLARGKGAVFSASKVPVTKSSNLYFVLDKKAAYYCDTSTIDMLITN